MRVDVYSVCGVVGRLLPSGVVRVIVERSTRGLGVGVCLHRIGPAEVAQRSLMPEFTHDAAEVDRFLECIGPAGDRFTMFFDDGYDDSRVFIDDRSRRHPAIRWVFAVCPKKTIERHGFVWDAVADVDGMTVSQYLTEWESTVRAGTMVTTELEGVADHPDFLLSTVEQCRDLAGLANVELADHTDHHVPASWLDDARLVDEINQSEARFADAFGGTGDVVLPFGAPPFVEPHHVDTVVAHASGIVWTIDPQPYDDDDDARIRPRFAWASDGLDARSFAFYIAVKSILHRRRKRRNSA